MDALSPRVRDLLARGVRMPHPASVWVGDEVDPARVAAEVTLHPGTRLTGAHTALGRGAVLGAEAPMTVDDCQLGAGVELKGGFASGAVFLEGAQVASGAHIRPGTILEEEASAAHTVGFKQTILMPFVTTGSLINFCDCLMAGGTSRKNHSEVGSSYIHFNFTPHQDKATASLIGDVPRGVMLNQPPIFLGGQGGLVGPARIGYGCVIPAGVVWRRDATEDHHLLQPPADTAHGPRPYRLGVYRDAARLLRNNLTYLGNMRALHAWYQHARAPMMTGLHDRWCREGALVQLEVIHAERLKRLAEWIGKLGASAKQLADAGSESQQREGRVQTRIVRAWPAIEEGLSRGVDGAGLAQQQTFLAAWSALSGRPYVSALAALTPEQRTTGTAWLQAIVDCTVAAGRAAEGD